MNDDQLKACPFCGGEAKLYDDYGRYRVACNGVICRMDCATNESYSKDEIIAAWNTRAESDPAVQAETVPVEMYQALSDDFHKLRQSKAVQADGDEVKRLRELLKECVPNLYHPHEPKLITDLEKRIEQALFKAAEDGIKRLHIERLSRESK